MTKYNYTTTEIAKELQRVMLDWYDMKLKYGYVLRILRENPDFKNDTRALGVDTVAREGFASLVSLKLINKRWPLNQDGEKVWMEFQAQLSEALVANGQDYYP